MRCRIGPVQVSPCDINFSGRILEQPHHVLVSYSLGAPDGISNQLFNADRTAHIERDKDGFPHVGFTP